MRAMEATQKPCDERLWIALKLLSVSPDIKGPRATLLEHFRSVISEVAPAGGLDRSERIVRVLTTGLSLSYPTVAEIAEISVQRVKTLAHDASNKILEDVSNSRTIIVEDSWLSRKDLEHRCLMLGREVLCSTADANLALRASLVYRPSLTLIDIDLCGNPFAGEILALKMREASIKSRIVFITAYHEAEKISSLVENSSVVLKPAPVSYLENEIRGPS